MTCHGEQRPDAGHDPTTYFDRPLLKKPHWEWEVVTYLFLGGVMGGGGILTSLAQRSEDEPLARTSRYISVVLSIAAPGVLISHLGRPERFLNMLRIVKFKSPMSMGVWGLVGYGTLAGANALVQHARLKPVPLATSLQALFGAFIAGYTGVLLSATAIPFWAKGKYHIPAMSVCSAVAGACAINSIALCADPGGGPAQVKLERLEALSAALELAIILHFREYAGATGKPMFEGARGEKFRKWTLALGIGVPLVLSLPSLLKRTHDTRPNILRTLAAGALTLAGGYILRETLVEAGKTSADDPRQAFVQPE